MIAKSYIVLVRLVNIYCVSLEYIENSNIRHKVDSREFVQMQTKISDAITQTDRHS